MSIYRVSKFLKARFLASALVAALFISIVPISFLSLQSLAATVNESSDPIPFNPAIVAGPPMYIIDGYKWEDSDGSGDWVDEGTLSGWTINITNGIDSSNTVTDGDGYYSFTVPAGTWTVTEESQVGWEQTGVRKNNADNLPETNCQFVFTDPLLSFDLFSLAYADVVPDGSCDFGNQQISTPNLNAIIEGYKWNDANGDGVWDEDEETLSGWTIILSNDDGEEVDRVETDSEGYYSFAIVEGSWVVSEAKQGGWQQTGLVRNGNTEAGFNQNEPNCEFVVGSEEVIPDNEISFRTLDINNFVSDYTYSYYRCTFGNQQVEEEEEKSSSSSSGTKVGLRPAPAGQVLGASTSGGTKAPACGRYLFDYMRAGTVTYAKEVIKLQTFLSGQGFFTPTTGIFDGATEANVRLFQGKHMSEILSPWDINEPTGYVYKTTRWKINNIICPGSEVFPDLEATF